MSLRLNVAPCSATITNMDIDDSISLNEIAALHPLVEVGLFIPFVHYWLRELTDGDKVVLTVSFDNFPFYTRKLEITWDEETPTFRYPPIQSSVVTEWAAYGIAAAVLALYTDFRFSRVSVRGERFDYWVTDGVNLCGLEVSGMLHGSLTARTQAKQQQLLANPFIANGYVCVVHFGEALVQLAWYGGES